MTPQPKAANRFPGFASVGGALPDTHVVPKTVRAHVAIGRAVHDEISPDSNLVVLIDAIAAVLERETDLSCANIGRQRRVANA